MNSSSSGNSNNQQSEKGSAKDTTMKEPTIVPTSSVSTIATTAEFKKPPGTGPVSITMDAYHQIQQKRLLERQQQEQSNPPPRPNKIVRINRPKDPEAESPAVAPEMQPSLNALEQIVSIVQATVPALPLPSQPQEVPMPGPDLANIIFGSAPSTAANTAGNAAEKAAENIAEKDAGQQSGPPKPAAALDGQSGGNGGSYHRKSVGGSSSNASGAVSQSQPRTTSPPTPVSGSSLGAHKSQNSKGQKSMHAIELMRIAAEILQLPPTTTGSALIYYHKYRAYLHQAHKRGDRDNEATKADEYLFATACLHLACKCTEVSRKVRDLVNVTYRVMNPSQPVLSLSIKPGEKEVSVQETAPSSGSCSQPSQPTNLTAPPPTVATYWHIRDSLLTTELMLLRILQFDLDVPLPFSDVLRIYKGMGMVFSPTDEEAAHLYPNASNFDVFLPGPPVKSSNSTSPNKHGTSASSSVLPVSLATPHTGIHPTLSALVQISTTFCIDALCSSTIALNSSSRALAMGTIYLAVRSAGLELPLPFEEWCHAWGRPNIATGFGLQVAGSGGYGIGSLGMGVGSIGSGVGSSVSVGVNGIMGLSSSGTNNLFVLSPRPTNDSTMFMEGLEMANVLPGANGGDPVYSQTHSPLAGNSMASPSVPASLEGVQGQQEPSNTPSQQPMTIVDEVRKVVQELGSFYNR
ncbi:hypothetical protein BC939DRAFT_524633 [Gamsiella multidivaricata]|uniref:uncharacterized protein n=1 Tax=Gamsiella multidivaricata TaxID=101098 RepID=UPI002221199F|nr:uncharacterized protein BC939DRAFT_524633 [Gamsiella multidivaricata]KAG0368253.1 hypothetical protein BGZ54_002347 [Gamsiella multidivaricata]KAI7832361.1 hypothetical protein BC939DRAFT_524633 [Gamsiella multidivaricata]